MTLQELILYLLSQGISINAIAENAGVSRGSPYNWVSGQIKNIRADNARALAEAFDLKLEYNKSGEAKFYRSDIPELDERTRSFINKLKELFDTELMTNWPKLDRDSRKSLQTILRILMSYDSSELKLLENILKKKPEAI